MAPAVEILKGVAGDDFRWKRGDVVDMSDEDAKKWADGHRAQLVDRQRPEGPIETTEKPTPAGPSDKPDRSTTTRPSAPERTGRSTRR